MDVVFGLWVDSGAAPDHAGSEGGSLGAPVVGPSGLLDILETATGLGEPPVAQVVRIAAFQSALERLGGDRFWSRSLAMDPWATARTLLQWRDELVNLGWRPSDGWMGSRLVDLAAAANEASELPRGIADRTARLLRTFAGDAPSPLRRIRLIDPLDVHPSSLRRLVGRLKELGTVVEPIAFAAAAPAGTALGRLQRWMLAGGTATSGADGTVTVATSSSTPLAVEVLGQWFAVRGAEPAALVAQDGDTDVLDHGLCGAAQPRAGRSRRSPHRGSLQLLLLAFKTGWRPFDPHALMELLVFAGSPVPPRAAWRLAAALEEAPGRGGTGWTEAWAAIEAAELERAGEDARQRNDAEARLARWRAWAEPEGADPATGTPVGQALAICERVTLWATRRHSVTSDSLYLATATLAGEVRGALASLDRSHLPRNLVERIIDQALDLGHPNPGTAAEAARWRCVSHPGAVWAPVPAVVWWNFRHTAEGAARAPWTQDERRELTDRGCPPDDVAIHGRAASAAWERAVFNARERLLFVSGGLDCEADEELHPLAHRLAPALEILANRIRLEDALSSPTVELAGTTILRDRVAPAPIPDPRPTWPTPPGFAARREVVTESATSLEGLLSCQLMWALRHVARLRPGRVRSIPDANRLLGNLAHAIACEIFAAGEPPHPAEAADRAKAMLESRIDQLAAPLRHPELAEELTFARRRLPAAMAGLAQTLRDNALTVEETEMQASGTFEELLTIRGAIDLVARDTQGNAVIVDLKWSRSGKSRVEELGAGKAVQLATYGALVARDAPYRAGYYLINQRQFATLAGNGLVGRSVDGARSLRETWDAIVDAWRLWQATADAGTLVALGVDGCDDHVPDGLPITREVRCDWCDYSTLCRVRGLA
jgi:ATP-dependent helicase/nuclease subunit B